MKLTAHEKADLSGTNGWPAQWAMELLVNLGEALEAPALVPITQAHLVGAYHSGEANIALLDALIDAGAKVRVPTSLNATSADLSSSAPPCYALQDAPEARAVVSRLVRIGCRATLTCSPYFLPSRPQFGEVVAWAESNAVLYANSVIGARSLKSAQFFDLACALTGKTLHTGVVADAGRVPELVVDVQCVPRDWFDDELGYQFVGYAVGEIARDRVPLITGLPPSSDDASLQGLCASAGVSGAMALLHAQGLTPEASQYDAHAGTLETHFLSRNEIEAVASKWPSQGGQTVDAVCVGAPHFGVQQIRALDAAFETAGQAIQVPTFVSISRELEADAQANRAVQRLRSRGVSIVQDACTYYGPLLGEGPGLVATNSVKWATYGAANLQVRPAIMNLAHCAIAAVQGKAPSIAQSGWSDAND